jgi:acetylornithine deacetylase/succinyl-diaminopimelate desuccinylase-like protein
VARTADQKLDTARIFELVERTWDASILPILADYIRIPNRSPMFDPDWREHGHMDRAVGLVEAWCRKQPLPGMHVETVRLEGRTPILLIEIPGRSDETVLLYGHLDKQPEFTGWREGLGPWQPVMDGDRLYGRGGADDGYAVFAALVALVALAEHKVAHARAVVLVETCEESGSFDLPFYLELLADRIGSPSLVVCLDSGCGNYDQLWCTTSLRGLVSGSLTVELLREGVHSGDASGVVASSFRVLRRLLDRLEDADTGTIVPREFHVEIPGARLEQARRVAEILGDSVYSKFPLHEGVRPVASDLTELVLARTWRPALAITGAAGLPPLEDAGNVLRPMTAVKVSLRLPPTCPAESAARSLKELLEKDPPYGARVRFDADKDASGWSAPDVAPWLGDSIERASRAFFDAEAAFMGEGGTIPFMAMLGEKFPEAQFLITGVLGPHSNAHGPNEFLHVPTAKRVTAAVAAVVADHFVR